MKKSSDFLLFIHCTCGFFHEKFSIVEFIELIEYIRTLHINLYPSRLWQRKLPLDGMGCTTFSS